jgi:hypothetical protein
MSVADFTYQPIGGQCASIRSETQNSALQFSQVGELQLDQQATVRKRSTINAKATLSLFENISR